MFGNYWNIVSVLKAYIMVSKISPIIALPCLPFIVVCGDKHDVLEARMHFYVVLNLA